MEELTLLNSFQSVASLTCPSHLCTGDMTSAEPKGKQSESELHLRCIATLLLAGTESLSMMYWTSR